MKKYKVQKIIVCEVSVWGYVETEHIEDAMIQATEIGTGDGHDHEIISDIKTISIEINEVTE